MFRYAAWSVMGSAVYTNRRPFNMSLSHKKLIVCSSPLPSWRAKLCSWTSLIDRFWRLRSLLIFRLFARRDALLLDELLWCPLLLLLLFELLPDTTRREGPPDELLWPGAAFMAQPPTVPAPPASTLECCLKE